MKQNKFDWRVCACAALVLNKFYSPPMSPPPPHTHTDSLCAWACVCVRLCQCIYGPPTKNSLYSRALDWALGILKYTFSFRVFWFYNVKEHVFPGVTCQKLKVLRARQTDTDTGRRSALNNSAAIANPAHRSCLIYEQWKSRTLLSFGRNNLLRVRGSGSPHKYAIGNFLFFF